MPEGGIYGPEQRRVCGDEQQQRTVRREHLSKTPQRGLVVLDVLEDVEADDRVERTLHVRGIALDDLDAVDSVPEHLRKLRVGLERNYLVGEAA